MNQRRASLDAWAILGVPPGSSPELVRAQYLRLVRLNHPDRYAGNPQEQARHEEIMKQVTWAYQEIVQGRAQAASSATAPPRRTATMRRMPRFDIHDLQCRAHGRWAVSFCTICGAPLCSRCDESLSGYCDRHRPRGRF
ncbi:MAG: J domain-containing protein [Firmicutes bacterium]|nr:J domain-containing protein [Bacillota bacterium]